MDEYVSSAGRVADPVPEEGPYFDINTTNLVRSGAASCIVSLFQFNLTADNMSVPNSDAFCDPPAMPLPEYEQAFIIFVYALVSITAIAGNAIVCYIVTAFEKMRKTENIFIFNLAITDMVMALLCVPFTFVPNLILATYPFGLVMCKVMNFTQTVSVMVSSYTMVIVSVERYVGIVYPFRPRMTRRKALSVICITWIASFAVALPTAIFSQLLGHTITGKDILQCVEIWPGEEKNGQNHQSYVYGMVLMAIQYFIPVGIMIFTYSTIAIHVWGTKTPGEALKDRDRRLKDEKMRMTQMMVVVVLLYVISWLPLNVFIVIQDQFPRVLFCYKYIHYVWFGAHWLAMSHATHNPIIYFWMNSKFRAGFLYVLKFMFCFRRQSDQWLVDNKLISGYPGGKSQVSQVFTKFDGSVSNNNLGRYSTTSYTTRVGSTRFRQDPRLSLGSVSQKSLRNGHAPIKSPSDFATPLSPTSLNHLSIKTWPDSTDVNDRAETKILLPVQPEL